MHKQFVLVTPLDNRALDFLYYWFLIYCILIIFLLILKIVSNLEPVWQLFLFLWLKIFIPPCIGNISIINDSVLVLIEQLFVID